MGDIERNYGKPWAQVVQERELRECKRCGAVIANSREYGRPPQPSDPNLCECCEVMTPEQAERLANL